MNLYKYKFFSATYLPFRSFSGIGTSATHLIHKPKPIKRVFSREYLENYNKNPNFEADRIKADLAEKQHLKDMIRFTYPSNDKNPENHLKVLKKPQHFLSESRYSPPKPSSLPIYTLVEPRKPKITIQGIRRRIHSKLKKLIIPMKKIIGMHIYDALALMASRNRSTWMFVAKTLKQVKMHAVNRGFDETRLYVVEALTGKHKRNFGLRFHGRGRAGRIKHDLCQLKIKLEEKTYEELYKQIYVGKTPPMLAYALRRKILEGGGGYKEIAKNTHILTAKGRQQQRLMLKRRVFMTYIENLVNIAFFSFLKKFFIFWGFLKF